MFSDENTEDFFQILQKADLTYNSRDKKYTVYMIKLKPTKRL